MHVFVEIHVELNDEDNEESDFVHGACITFNSYILFLFNSTAHIQNCSVQQKYVGRFYTNLEFSL